MVTQQSFSENKKPVLILEDNTIFGDHGFGSTQNTTGEVIFSPSTVEYSGAPTNPNLTDLVTQVNAKKPVNCKVEGRDTNICGKRIVGGMVEINIIKSGDDYAAT